MKLRPHISLASSPGEELFLVYDADAVAHVRAGARRVVALARAAAENGGALPRGARDGGDASASDASGHESSGSEHEDYCHACGEPGEVLLCDACLSSRDHGALVCDLCS